MLSLRKDKPKIEKKISPLYRVAEKISEIKKMIIPARVITGGILGVSEELYSTPSTRRRRLLQKRDKKDG